MVEGQSFASVDSKVRSMDSQIRQAVIFGSALLALLGVLIIPPAFRAVAGGPWPPGGPLSWPAEGGTLSAARTTPGRVYSVGIIDPPTNRGGSSAILDGVVPNTQVPSGLTILGYRVIRNTEGIGGFIGVAEGFLPQGSVSHSLHGFVYSREDPLFEVVVVLKATRPGNFLIPGFTLHYHVGRTHYMAVYHQGAGLCAGATIPNDCDLSYGMP
jgi:hypothetical protein